MQGLGIFNEESERAVLGSILKDEKCLDVVKDYIVDKDAFYIEKHQTICSNEQTWNGRKCQSYCDVRNLCPYNNGSVNG